MIQNKIFRTDILVVMSVIFGILLVSTQAFAFCPPTCAPKADYTQAMMTGNMTLKNNATITVTTDKTSYISGEIITVSGHTTNPYPGQDVAMKLTSPSGNVLFATQIALDNNGDFSSQLNTTPMTENGQYTIYVQQGDEQARTNQTQFILTGIPSTQSIPTPTSSSPTASSITASTDKSSYEPGDMVIITGMVQQPTNENPVTIIVKNSTGGVYAVGQVALLNNIFSHNFVLSDDIVGGIYTVNIKQGEETTQLQFQVTVRQIQVIPVFNSEIIVRGENTSLIEYGNVEVSTIDHSITIQVDTTKIQNGFITEEYQIPKHVIDTLGGQIGVKENGNDIDCIQTESDVERILDCPMQAGTNQLMFVGTVVIPESAPTPQPESAQPSAPSTPPSVPSSNAQISIVSVQATDQGGNPVSSFSRGTNCYVKVVLNSQSNTPSLMTVDLFGSDSVSLGVGSVKSTFGAGQSSITLSFPIPNDATVGQDNIYVDTYSDWISRGGIPLTPEYSSTVEVK